ncbi:MAG TPA: transglutaminase-like cysteine peptidase [Burkholderiaceae bacterium]|jgi:predicted transglutaminase-like cysteine proteinase|nr:transglutaminase-like cysteine peptidase [Burkholderiaceae bacterium]
MTFLTSSPFVAVFLRFAGFKLGWAGQRLLVIVFAWLVGTWSYSAPDFDRMLELVVQRWGGTATNKFQNWRNLVLTGGSGSEMERLSKVNEFFNRQVTFGEDSAIWGQADYWATPLETLGRGSGDCEDFVIAKYFTLRLVGVGPDKLRLIYVRARTGSAENVAPQAHMVLAYYAQPEGEPLVLDNLISDIRPASRRPDLTPVFSFNSQGIFAGASSTQLAPAVGSGRLSRWEDLIKRARAEGLE